TESWTRGGLPAPRPPTDRRSLRLSIGEPGEGIDQPRQLALAADERRESALLRDVHLGDAAVPIMDRVRRDRLAFAAHAEGTHRLDREEAAHQAMGGIADQDRAGLRGRL